jgi:hypothetical protein
VGATADMPLNPWGAVVIGCLAGLLSTVGFRFFTVLYLCFETQINFARCKDIENKIYFFLEIAKF